MFGILKRGSKVYTQGIPDGSGSTLIPIIEDRIMLIALSILMAGAALMFWMSQSLNTIGLTIPFCL